VSKALKFLCGARPKAMGAYFSFLRANGASLDPKTRALISVITKVASQTDAGLKQYAQKAVREGISPDEILDAIMMAFPALGFSKIVWAVDVLLECGVLDETALEPEEGESWHDICDVDEAASIHVRKSDGRYVFAVNHGESWRVFEAKCPHAGTSLAACEIRGASVECPSHGWTFDLYTGDCTRFGTKGLTEFESRISDNRLFAYW